MKGLRPASDRVGTVRQNVLQGGIQTGYATSIFTGDPLALSGGFFVRATAGGSNTSAVFVGVDYISSAGRAVTSPFWPASTAATEINVHYEDFSDTTDFEILANGIVPQTAIGSYISYTFATAGSTLSGQSNTVVDVATINASATNRDLRIVGIVNGYEPGGIYNAWGTNPTRIKVQAVRATNALIG